MNVVSSRYLIISLRLYIATALIVAAVLSPLALSAVPALVLVWYVCLLRWPFSRRAVLMTYIFIFFAIALLYTAHLGIYLPVLISLPLIYGIEQELVKTSATIKYLESAKENSRRFTSVSLSVILSLASVLIVALLTGTTMLLVPVAALTLYFLIVGFISLRKMPLRSVKAVPIQHQMVAGTSDSLQVELEIDTPVGGLLMLKSPYDWMEVSPEALGMKNRKPVVELVLTPELSGPSDLRLYVQDVDRWGLFRRSYHIEPVKMFIIPRARYAAWLAEKYLSGTARGSLLLISHIESRKPVYGLRRGVEYYGSQLYQPGDSLKNIDWKHSSKYNELISKEFAEFHGETAIILINLSVGDETEADILAYNIIVTAVSLAQESIPAALAAYNHEDVQLITGTLHGRHLVSRCLKIAQEMVTYISPKKYLNPPDIRRLRANMNRIRSSDNQAVKVLSELLRIEYDNLKDIAMKNPATRALTEALAKAEEQSNVVVISQRNHDAEALEFNVYNLHNKGNAVISV
jgi:hypothetical protein